LANITVSAEFELVPLNNYTVSIGTLSYGNITAEPQYGPGGTPIILTIQPDSGYRLKADTLKYNDGTDHLISGNSFVLPLADVTVSAKFELVPSNNYTVSIAPLINGNITAEPQNGTVGTTITLTIQPKNSSFRLKANTLKYNDGTDHPISGNSFPLPAANVTVSAEFEAVINTESQNTGSTTELTSALTSIRNSGKTDFDIIVTADFSSAPVVLTDAAYKNKTITLKGSGAERTISLSSNGSLFTVGEDVTLVLDNNVTLQGKSGNNAPLVTVNGGDLVMNNGAKVTGNTIPSTSNITGGGVALMGGTFTMNGGEISSNTLTPYSHRTSGGGGVLVDLGGIFIMTNGKITNNTASCHSESLSGGGVLVRQYGNFTMKNGEISNNTCFSTKPYDGTYSSYGGGGIAIYESGAFVMEDGVISGNTAEANAHPSAVAGSAVFSWGSVFKKTGGIIYGTDAGESLKNKISAGQGHVVQMQMDPNIFKRDTTAGATVNLDSAISGSAGGWE
jgi:hypothetical protein